MGEWQILECSPSCLISLLLQVCLGSKGNSTCAALTWSFFWYQLTSLAQKSTTFKTDSILFSHVLKMGRGFRSSFPSSHLSSCLHEENHSKSKIIAGKMHSGLRTLSHSAACRRGRKTKRCFTLNSAHYCDEPSTCPEEPLCYLDLAFPIAA